MKDKLVNHIVNSTTKHKKMVIIITIILCILSIVAMVFLLKLDTSFKGLAGDGIPEVEQFETVIEEFSASGTTTVTLEPKKEEQKPPAPARPCRRY
jgi:predicted RND superfamily exporter protein